MTQFMTHIVAGFPSLKESEDIAIAMIKQGVAYLEIQIPFSDPIADGPTIAQANQVSLDNGISLQDCFDLMKRLREKTDIPLFFMTYYNIPFVYGMDAFCAKVKEIGCSGLIIPDIPFDEEPHTHYIETCSKHELSPIMTVSPHTPDDRLKAIGGICKTLLYCISGDGTTGKKQTFDDNTRAYLDRVRSYTDVPLALGFGIKNQDDIAKANTMADIIVIGSQIIHTYAEDGIPGVKALLCTAKK